MITALQNFISKQSKVLFPVLLLVIIVSFVLYLSQGSSVFDLLPDPNREKRVLYGVDLNHPDERRKVTMSNRVAADFGAIISPSAEAFEKADRQFLENLQRQIQIMILVTAAPTLFRLSSTGIFSFSPYIITPYD